ncbi:MAG: serine/threonine-protein kinase, partial [Planctomycetota bacterium]
MDETEIFSFALQKFDLEARDEFLREACGTNAEMLARLKRLLEAHENPNSLLNPPELASEDSTEAWQQEASEGGSIGPYKILQKIGEGGMGVVYMAEQTQPVKRRVALKIVKPGMHSRQVLTRFEAERQALALMDHPNIAKVLDAGATPQGRPYFVMELVNGLPLTEFCDQYQLEPPQRLELFIKVCQGIQHAHQKGIIHRDLKPSNILVAEYDETPVPKIIDFGVAKATSQQLTEKTLFTEFGQIIGTLEYMSPEQAKRNQLDIDTRSDIYSLGIVLYHLLTGETPFDSARMR